MDVEQSDATARPEWRHVVEMRIANLALIRSTSGQVLVAMVFAILLGIAAPSVAIQMKPLGDAFFRLMRMMLAPVIFTTLVMGLTNLGHPRQLGRIGIKTLIYFEVVSTLALLLGIAMINLIPVGAGFHATNLGVTDAVSRLFPANAEAGSIGTILQVIPANLLEGLVRGDIPQVLFVSVVVGAGLAAARPEAIIEGVEQGQKVVFTIMGFIMRLAPLGAFGALAAAIGTSGSGALIHLASLVALFYVSLLAFIIVVLGGITASMGLSLFNIILLVKDELLLVFGTVSTEFVMPRLIAKLSRAGVPSEIAGFVMPAGYSFNQDGTAIYMSLAIGFIAQATETRLSIGEQLAMLLVMLLTSKGSTGMAGGSLVKIAATVQTSQILPLASVGLLFGIERPIGSALGATNVLGNVVATFVIAKWERRLSAIQLRSALNERSNWSSAPLSIRRGIG